MNEPFTFQRDEFDLVHSRLVVNGIDKSRWRSYIADCIRYSSHSEPRFCLRVLKSSDILKSKSVTKPGGWVQFVEMYHNIQSDNGTISDDHAIRRLGDQYVGVMEDKKDLRAPMHLEGMLVEAGMVEVGSRMIQLPVNGWSNSKSSQPLNDPEVFLWNLPDRPSIPILYGQLLRFPFGCVQIRATVRLAKGSTGHIKSQLHLTCRTSSARYWI